MYTVRIEFFLGELYGFSYCACGIGNAQSIGKTKNKVYVTAGFDFEENLHGKILIIDNYLNRLKASEIPNQSGKQKIKSM
jgi:hypothetical protein